MKRLKTSYFIKSDSCKDCHELIIIHRRFKKQSRIRRVMWIASAIKWDHALQQKLNQYDKELS